jgi:ABC-type glutathione transport system ATPase component
MIRLTAQDLGKRFGRRVLFRALSFELTGGQSLAITGANGSGKSTLVRILAGVMRASRGEVALQVNGAEVEAEDRPLHAGLVAPYLNVYDGFSARENLAFIARARHLPDARARIDDLLGLVALLDRADDLVATYGSRSRPAGWSGAGPDRREAGHGSRMPRPIWSRGPWPRRPAMRWRSCRGRARSTGYRRSWRGGIRRW